MKIGVDLDNTLLWGDFLFYRFFAGVNFFSAVCQSGRKEKLIDESDFLGSVKSRHKIFKPSNYHSFPRAVEAIAELRKRGATIHIVSSRPTFKPIVAMTLGWIKKSGLEYDKLVLGCRDKANYAKREKLDVFVDDMKKICDNMTKVGIASIQFCGKLKKQEKLQKGKLDNMATDLSAFQKLYDWDDILAALTDMKFPQKELPTFDNSTLDKEFEALPAFALFE